MNTPAVRMALVAVLISGIANVRLAAMREQNRRGGRFE